MPDLNPLVGRITRLYVRGGELAPSVWHAVKDGPRVRYGWSWCYPTEIHPSLVKLKGAGAGYRLYGRPLFEQAGPLPLCGAAIFGDGLDELALGQATCRRCLQTPRGAAVPKPDPRQQPGGRYHYGDKAAMIAELHAAGVLHNGEGPVESKRNAPALAGMVERVRQKAGYEAVALHGSGWRPARGKSVSGFCAVCGGVMASPGGYRTGTDQGDVRRRAHAECVSHWLREAPPV